MRFRFFSSLILLAVLLVACTPVSSTPPPAEPVDVESSRTLRPPPATTEPSVQAIVTLVETLAPTPFPVVTSRGPHLEATDPTSVKMASGGLQLVEFFEFW
jgi:hypothetical protein